ncbi:nuclear distribution protein nudE-like 1-A [Anopheles marshallii]|uniref:nuclear distribution protein nudE-like 1-A n=1 Tax=Anopheles marshallii TaxID=1521116 RepID=UPI00237C0604|nr:nuclear distribution protein nudE-like 1-A [Anopheles marshallii]
MEDKLFTSVEEECLYWKERCLKVSQERDDAQREFDDFTTESQQLEAELEMTVEQQEKKIRDLNQLVNQLHGENESYKRKMQYTENETNKIDADFRQLAKENEKLKVYIRELEQKNDDLERANRVASESVAEFESMLNQAYEKNALLELEVDEKERMQIKLQRLMDEARDLKQELKVRTLKPEDGEKLEEGEMSESKDDRNKQLDPSNESTSTTTIATAVTTGIDAQQMNNVCLDGGTDPTETTLAGTKLETLNNNLNTSKQRSSFGSPMVKLSASKLNDFGRETSMEQQDSVKTLDGIVGDGVKAALLSPGSQLIIERNGNNASSTALVPGGLGGINAPMAPSDRVSTLNIVADLLRRLDNMEAKLKAWKIRKPSSRAGTGSAGTMASNRTSLHTSNTISNMHHSSGTGGLLNSHQNNQHHHHSNHHYQSNHNTDSNLSLNSLGSAEGTLLLTSPVNCCGTGSSNTIGGNVQLHSYQPSTITIGTQTSQHLPASSLAAKTELLRTNK